MHQVDWQCIEITGDGPAAYRLHGVFRNAEVSSFIGSDASRTTGVPVTVPETSWPRGYPPDLQDAAVQNVVQQAEPLSAEWAV